MSTDSKSRDRIKAGIATAAFEGLLAYALISGMAVDVPAKVDRELKIFDIAMPTPPRPVEKPVHRQAKSQARDTAASPPSLKAKTTEIVAAVPAIALIVPPTVVVTLKPGTDSDPSAGAAPVAGPGSGGGGKGTGNGSG